MKQRRRRGWMLAAAVVAISVLGASAHWLWLPGRAFDATAWQAREQAGDSRAAQMAERLIAGGELTGMTRAQVVSLLGEPPGTGYFRRWDMVYRLGPERGFMSIDSEWLVLRFDADSTIGEARLITD